MYDKYINYAIWLVIKARLKTLRKHRLTDKITIIDLGGSCVVMGKDDIYY